MIACEIADRMLDHTIRHWNSIPERETTIEQALFHMTHGLIRWTDVSNALLRRENAPSEVVETMRRIIERLRNNEIVSTTKTKAISSFIDASINSEASNALHAKMIEDSGDIS